MGCLEVASWSTSDCSGFLIRLQWLSNAPVFRYFMALASLCVICNSSCPRNGKVGNADFSGLQRCTTIAILSLRPVRVQCDLVACAFLGGSVRWNRWH